VAKVPDPKEFAALHRRMDLATRSRLDRLARRGQLASNPQDAALVVAFAERALRQIRWVVVLDGMLLALSLLSVALAADSTIRWLSLAVVLVAAIAIPVFLLWHRPRLVRGQLLNRKLADQKRPGEAGSPV
jgi:hypothetical protein